MAFASLFTLLDDIAAIMDDVAVMTKMAAKKTAGVVGDDLALNANQVTGVRAERELPIIWAVAKGSLINKLILIPVALILAVFAPVLIVPLLMLGGAYLCFEGVEKLWHKFAHRHHHDTETTTQPENESTSEADKIKGAIRTDFILSAEIIIIALGVVKDYDTMVKILVLFAIGVGMTVLVYGLVAILVKLDDFGAYLVRQGKAKLGNALLWFMPWFMRGLSVVGTLAMFLVGGGIFVHNWGWLHETLHALHWDSGIMEMLSSLVVGLLVGAICCAIVLPIMKWREHKSPN
ncbi:DUF808 domain-containing protein [Alysiella filiformis]|uniref:Inner membrane protein YedI n=1 Tax=Alysiella filiformis DSM 16848 TaxID=1120981 RepID=A0A286EH15_9NEIS|nr:DUF808 domain-containing protein [Alysiella filiformis]QMT32345.1 DUF808 domain-containing protein [Alysiella filiformis]UBQ56735.1 DUF808 domain-containing protein [Alysiella filiformis DSM 16848]SOD70215.1 hypothetical protein SAMN02746062_02029 [Alysiella filiformis DSM 16848]